MASNLINQKKKYGRYSRLRHYDLVRDAELKKIRLGLKNRTFINRAIQRVSYTPWKIPNKWEYRPDLISNYFYGTPQLWWILQEYNQFFRVPQDFFTDRLIKIPDADQIESLLL